MRLLAVTWTSDRTEAALWLGLKARGWAVEVVCDPAEPQAAAFRAAGLAVTLCAIRSKLDWRAVRVVRARIEIFAPDVVYAPTTKGLAISLLATRRNTGGRKSEIGGRRSDIGPRTLSASTIHPPTSDFRSPTSDFRPVPVIGFRGTLGRVSRWDPVNWLTYFHPRCARVVCLSEAVRLHLAAHGVRPERLVRVYLGQDPTWYAAQPSDFRLPTSDFHPPPPLPTRASLGIPDDAWLVGFTGAMRPIKGVDVLIGALGRMTVSVPVTALLVGEVRDPHLPVLAARAMRAAADAGRRLEIVFTGARPDAAALAGLCDVFVMPTLRDEGLSRSVMEAMAQGVPAVASAVGGLPELVVDGVTGALVPPRDAAALAAALMRYAAAPDLCRAHGAGARERIANCFHIRQTIAEMDRIFREVLETGGQPVS